MRQTPVQLCLMIVLFVGNSSALAQITDQFRSLQVDAVARDAIFDEDDVIVGDDLISDLAGLFNDILTVEASTITGFTTSLASQTSIIDASDFSMESQLITTSQEDGASSNFASSTFRVVFDLPSGGVIELSQIEIEAVLATINDNPFDDEFERSDDASVSVVLCDADFKFYEQTLVLGREDAAASFSDSFQFELPAGTYTFSVDGQINGDDGFNTVQGQPRGSDVFICIEGAIFANILGDVNCDGAVDLLDVGPFVDLIADGSFSSKADINQDGELNLLDVGPFVELLAAG